MHFSIGRSGHEDKILSGYRYASHRIRVAEVAETKDLDENTLLDLDKNTNLRHHDRTRERARRNTQVFLRAIYAISIRHTRLSGS
jgi:hypothetical protein